MALEQIPGSNQQILALEDEAEIRTAARAVDNYLGNDHGLTGRMVGFAMEATKAGSGGRYREAVVLWGEEAWLVAQSLEYIYNGHSSHVDRIDGKDVVHVWDHDYRLAAARILGLADPPEEIKIIQPENVAMTNVVDERELRHDSTTATWITGLLAKLRLVKLGNQSE